jgi:hypothetical protein
VLLGRLWLVLVGSATLGKALVGSSTIWVGSGRLYYTCTFATLL